MADDSTMSASVCLANATLVLADQVVRGQVTVEDGLITDVVEGGGLPTDSVDCRGDYLIPGLVEMHTDNLERHMEPRPAVDWPYLAALIAHDGELAATGITTVFDAMRVGSIPDNAARYDAYARRLATELQQARARGALRISHFLHLRAEVCSETLLDELAGFGADDHVGIVSLMDHTPGERQHRDLSALRVFLKKRRGMADSDFSQHVESLQAMRARHGVQHEAAVVEAARRFGAVLASHDDTTVDHVVASKRHGVRFAEFPTTLEAAQACRSAGIAIMMGAPNIVRGGSHSGNVSAVDLARADLLDIVSSDYIPAALLMSAFALAELWQDLPRAINCVTLNPADASGLSDRGRISPGCRGDLVRVSLLDRTPVVRGVWSAGLRI